MEHDTLGTPLDLQYFAEGAAGEGGEAGSAGPEAANGEAEQSSAARGRHLLSKGGESSAADGRHLLSKGGESSAADGRHLLSKGGESSAADGRHLLSKGSESPAADGRHLLSKGGESSAADGRRLLSKGSYRNVQAAHPQAESAGDRDAEFDELTRGKYREAFQRRTDAIIGRRFAELKSLKEREAAMAPLMESLQKRFGVGKGDMQGLQKAVKGEAVPETAGENGKAREAEGQAMAEPAKPEDRRLGELKEKSAQLMKAQEQRRQEEAVRQRAEAWKKQTAEAQELYPGLDLRQETENPEFKRLIFSGVPIRHAYEVVHRDEILGGAMAYTAQKTRERLAQDIAARGLRPQENGLTGQAAQIPGFRFERLSRAAKQEIERRALRGEKVNPRDYMDY